MRKLICIDLETTDLNPVTSHVLEIGAVVFDIDTFKVLDEFETLVRPTPIWALENLPPEVEVMHQDNGLLDELEHSRVPRRYEAEALLLDFLQKHPETQGTPMVGSNIWFDRSFMRLHLEEAEKWFHYRNIDVSSFRELIRLVAPKTYEQFKTFDQPLRRHRALDDAHDTIVLLSQLTSLTDFC